jgi:xanthine dehydrogenase accessory factor
MSAVGQRPIGSRGIFAEIVRLQRAGQRAVLATPLWYTGSVPLVAESKLLLRDDGTMLGTVGGGLLEARVIETARQVLAGGKKRLLEFELTQDQAARTGMICGGRCAVLVEPIEADREAAVYAAVAQAVESHEPVVVVTLLPPDGGSTKVALLSDGEAVADPQRVAQALACAGQAEACPTLPEVLRTIAEGALKAGMPRFIEQPIRAHFDPITPRPTVFVFGAGHVAIPVAHLASLAGFRVVVIDDRAEFANRERFPGADDVIVASVHDAFGRMAVDETGYVVAITRGHAMDEEVVAHALRTGARYIGMIGSKRKVAGVLGRLRTQGFTGADLARVHAPIGVDINAETVEEIAVSIIAELIAVRRSAA